MGQPRHAPRVMQRPHGRSSRIRDQVYRAVVDLLREGVGYDLTIPLIARQSGVHQATIYRRWGSLPVLLEEVAAAGPARTAPLPDTGSLRGDLEQYAIAVADTLSGPLGVLLLRSAVSTVSTGDRRAPSPVLVERAEQLQTMLDLARDRGERPPTVDDLLDVVVAPLYFDVLFGRPTHADRARRLVDRLLASTAP